MNRLLCCFLAGALVSITLHAASGRYYAIELKGGSRVFSADPPIRKGRTLLFHSYPEGTYMSVPAAEVERVATLDAEPPKADKLSPGQTLYVGNAVEGPGYEMPSPPPPGPATPYLDPGYGYTADYWGGGGYYPPPRPPVRPPHVPSRIGPNGYPILAPPGSPGSVPPSIGPNGYPILH